MNYPIALFDLDGTIINSQIGITKSVQYALQSFGIVEENPETLVHFIGPPLHKSFQKYYDFDEKETRRAVEKYREYYRENGIFENELYSGIRSLLEELYRNSIKIVLATSKPQIFALQIVENMNIIQYFDTVFGSNLDLTRSDKSEIIRDVMKEYPNSQNKKFIMIGDKEHDIIGANKNNIDSVGVLWGFGSKVELETHQPRYIAVEINDLRGILLTKN